MTRKSFEQYFKEYIEVNIPSNDKPMLRQTWNDTIDSMCKGNKLKDRARDWSHPKRFYTKSKNKRKS